LVACSADDNAKFASCGRDRAVFVWDVPTGNVIRKFEGHDHVRALAVLLMVWLERSVLTLVWTKQGVNCVRYNADSSVLFSGSYDKTVRAWDIRARNAYMPIQVLDDFKDSVTSLVVSDHEIIAGYVLSSVVLTVDSGTDCVDDTLGAGPSMVSCGRSTFGPGCCRASTLTVGRALVAVMTEMAFSRANIYPFPQNRS
jgi:mitogen-activated protein kinase organizer 1